MGEKVLVQILEEKQIFQADGPTINAKLATTVTKFCKNKSTNDKIIKKLGSDILITSNCESLKVPILNPDILTNKKIRRFYKKRLTMVWHAKCAFLSKITVVGIENMSSDKTNELMNWRYRLMTFEWKDYQNLCEQDHSGSVYLLGHNLSESSERIKATHLFEFICQKATHSTFFHSYQTHSFFQ